MWAAKRDFPEICIILIRSGADVRRRSMEGLSALDYAVLHGSYASAYMIHEFDKLL
jgi:ankyrin repeat protein